MGNCYHRKAFMTLEEHKVFSAQVKRFVELQRLALDDLRVPNTKQSRIKEMVRATVSGYMPGLDWDMATHTLWEKPKCPPYSEMSERDFRIRIDLLWHLYRLEGVRRAESHRSAIMDTLMSEFGTLYIDNEW